MRWIVGEKLMAVFTFLENFELVSIFYPRKVRRELYCVTLITWLADKHLLLILNLYLLSNEHGLCSRSEFDELVRVMILG